MKTKSSPDDDLRLRSVLRDWKVDATLAPRFQEAVWRRIDRLEAQPGNSMSLFELITRWIATALPRPALAISYLTVLLAIGAGAGWTQARMNEAQVRDQLSLRYVQSVDPYQKAQ